jgi:hypothetical protein
MGNRRLLTLVSRPGSSALSGHSLRQHPGARCRALTLVEVIVAATVLALLSVGLLATLIQSRNLTEGSIYQNSANTIMQGYVEQIKNMEFSDLPYTTPTGIVMPGSTIGAPSSILTRGVRRVAAAGGGTENITDILNISNAVIVPDSALILEDETPPGVVENIKLFDLNNTPENTADDLRLRIWIWIKDLSGTSTDATLVRGITVIYSWRPNNSTTNARSFVGTVRTIRSAVPTF